MVDIIGDNFNRLIDTDLTAVDAEVIVIYNAPFAVRIEAVIVGALFVVALDFFLRIGIIDLINVGDPVDTVREVGTDKDIDNVVKFLQNVICAAADNNTAAFSRDFLNDFRLNQKYFIIERKIRHAGDTMHNAGTDRKGVKQAAGSSFIYLFKNLFAEISLEALPFD